MRMKLAVVIAAPGNLRCGGGEVRAQDRIRLREGNFTFLDNYGNKIPGRQRLFPSGTVRGGKRIPRA